MDKSPMSSGKKLAEARMLDKLLAIVRVAAGLVEAA
jgi:hypothetical protein